MDKSKAHRINQWEDWVNLSLELEFNPHLLCEISFDKGGGNWVSYEYIGTYPEVEELKDK